MINEEIFEKEIRERINEALLSHGITVNALANGDLTLQRKLNGQIREGRRLSAYTLYVILSALPDLSAEWLLKGWSN